MSEYEGKYDRRLLARCRELKNQLAEARALLGLALPYVSAECDPTLERLIVNALAGEESE